VICPHCGKDTEKLALNGAKRKSKGQTFGEWMAQFPEDHTVFTDDSKPYEYAKKVGMPDQFIELAWEWFANYYGQQKKQKRYTDWPAHFTNSIRNGWPRFWYIDTEGNYQLTNAGKQAEREYGAP
jgi:hypothetical protein